MITFKNEGPFGPEFTQMEVSVHSDLVSRCLSVVIGGERGGNNRIILSEESALYLAREIQRVFGKEKEKKKSYSGTL